MGQKRVTIFIKKKKKKTVPIVYKMVKYYNRISTRCYGTQKKNI